MAADISLAAPLPPHMPARQNLDTAAVVGIFVVTFLTFCSFGLIADLLVVVGFRAMGASESVMWSAGGFGGVAILGLSIWLGYVVWRDGPVVMAKAA